MKNLPYASERAAAVLVVERASRVCRSVQASIAALEKEDRSPATVADYAAQAVASATLAAAFPADVLVAEEEAADLRHPGRESFCSRVVDEARGVLPELDPDGVLEAIDRGGSPTWRPRPGERWWVLDPLDGTKGFLRHEQYAVALALIEDGQVVLGVLGCPELPQQPGTAAPAGCLFVAVRGQGASWRPLGGGDEQSLHVDAIADPAAAVFCESVEAGHSSHDASARVLAELGVRAAPCRMDSQCKYAAVARGEASAYLRLPVRADYQEKVWDHAAGMLIVLEAGGQVTDLQGQPLDFSRGRILRQSRGIIVSSGALHQQILATARRAVSRTMDDTR